MVEPTESESLKELQRFVDAMESIKREIHTIPDIVRMLHILNQKYVVFGNILTLVNKQFFQINQNINASAVSRIDNVHGDRNLVCACS